MKQAGAMAVAAVIAAGWMLAGCSSRNADLPRYNKVPPFQLVDQSGQLVSSEQVLAGKVWIANFFFTSCTGPCPRMSAQMHKLQSELADLENVRLVSFTIDPERDRPEVLAEYARRFGAVPGRWYLLTGSPEVLQQLNRDTFMLGDVSGALEHSTRMVLVDQQGIVRGYYPSDDPDAMAQLPRHARRLAQQQQ